MPHELDMYSYWTLFIFIVGYLCIIFEHKLAINKATSALLMAVGCWALQFADLSREDWNNEHLLYHIARVSQVIIFLLGALTIVETIHAHGGLNLILRIFRVSCRPYNFCIIIDSRQPYHDYCYGDHVEKAFKGHRTSTYFWKHSGHFGKCRWGMDSNWRFDDDDAMGRWATCNNTSDGKSFLAKSCMSYRSTYVVFVHP